MLIPSAVAAALAWTGALVAGVALAFQHSLMVPAMLGVMLWRYDEYARPDASAGKPRRISAGGPRPPDPAA